MSLLYILEKLQPGVFRTPELIEDAKTLKISLNALLSKTNSSEKRKQHSVKKLANIHDPTSS